MPFPTYTVNGVDMDDPQGRWHEHARMSVFPSHPGLRANSLLLPGVGGETLLPQAPHEPQEFVLHMVVNAVDANTGQMASTYPLKLVALHDNATALFQAMGLPRMTQGRPATIERHFSITEVHEAKARLIASSEISFEPGMDYAEYRLIFRISDGVWRGADVSRRLGSTNGEVNLSTLASSTAPVDGPLVTVAGRIAWYELTNVNGNGFRWQPTAILNAGEAVTINTRDWTVTAPYAIDPADTLPTPPTTGYAASPALQALGQTSGMALSILPEPDGGRINLAGSGRDTNHFSVIYMRETFF